jgi:hypothetical protein
MKTSTRTLAVAPWTLFVILASGSFASAGDITDLSPTTNLAPVPTITLQVRTIAPIRAGVTPVAGTLTPTPPPTGDIDLSFWASEIVKLCRAGVDEAVILSFLDNVGTVNLGADQIIYLKQQGVSRDIISAMLQHDFEIGTGLRPVPAVSVGSAFHAADFTSRVASTAVPQPLPASAAPAPAESRTVDPVQLASNVAEDDLNSPLAVDLLAYQPGMPDHGYRIREPYPEKVTEPIIIISGAGRAPNILFVQSTR